MIRVRGSGASAPAAGARKADKADRAFRLDGGPKAADSAASPSPPAPAATLAALIALQSGAGGGRAKSLAAARRALELLDRLRMSLLEGSACAADLDALALAASIRRDGDSSDAALGALCDEIALRARVELAKLGR